MAIKKQFGGAQIRRPGAYSRSQTSPDGGSASATTGVVLFMGEADAGAPGSAEGIQEYSAAAFNQLKAKYRSGPLVDAMKNALSPSRTPGVNGVGTFLVWKTNASVQAELDLANTYGTVQAKEYGVGGNRITYKNELSAETVATVTGSAVVTDFVGLDTQTLIVREYGVTAATVTFASPTNMADVLTQINAALADVTATNSAGKLTLSLPAGSNPHRNGSSRVFEIVSGSSLTKLFLTAGLVAPAAEQEASLEVIQPRDNITETAVVGGDVTMELGRDATGSCTAATVAVSSTAMTLVQTGATPASYTLSFVDYPLIGNLADAINELTGWTCEVPATVRTLACTTLDNISATGAYSTLGNMPCLIKSDANAVAEFFADSVLVDLEDQVLKGLPDAEGRLNLTGGVKGASASSDFDAGFSAAMAEELNIIVPCISQDASDDITAGITDSGSAYDIETVQAMLDTHLRFRGTIKNRSEAQGVTGYRKATKAAAFAQAATLGSELIQMVMEDVYVVDSTNNLKWCQPHVFAAMIAGMRAGTEIGEPLTHKFLAVSGVGHYVNATTGVVGGDYNPQLDYDQAINAGITSSEPAAGSHRIMVDNTTYGADENFVFNRGSVMEAAQYAAKTVRADAEAAFVGRKTAVITAEGIKTRIRTKLVELFKGRILTASDDAPQGFVEDTFIVTVTGNTAEVQVEIKPVQGLEFVFISFTLGDSFSAA